MIFRRTLILLTLCFLVLLWHGGRLSSSNRATDHKSPTEPSKMSITIRKAEASDLDAITEIGMKAFPANPQWSYRFPRRIEFAEDHLKFCRLRFADYLANARAGVYTIMLAEAPIKEDPTRKKVVSMSMWHMRGTHVPQQQSEGKAVKPPTDHFERRDADPKRMKAFRVALAKAKDKYFNSEYGEEQIQLLILATLPDYQRQGAATRLSQWGIDYARKEKLAVTLFASAIGERLYGKLGFTKLGEVETRVDGEEEVLISRAMVLKHSDNNYALASTSGHSETRSASFFRFVRAWIWFL